MFLWAILIASSVSARLGAIGFSTKTLFFSFKALRTIGYRSDSGVEAIITALIESLLIISCQLFVTFEALVSSPTILAFSGFISAM